MEGRSVSNLVSFLGVGFLGICVEVGSSTVPFYIVNVYSPCSMDGKRKLWVDLCMSK